MGVFPDSWIQEMALTYQMIDPFVDHQMKGGISYGLSSYGYDFRIADTFQVPRVNGTATVIDPKAIDTAHFDSIQSPSIDIPAGGYILGRTVEYFRIPRHVLTICTGKSTYARCGGTVYVTPFEPEWEGYATIAIVNSAGRPLRVYANEGIGQLIFLAAETPCAVSYADRKGRYQAQTDITHAKGT